MQRFGCLSFSDVPDELANRLHFVFCQQLRKVRTHLRLGRRVLHGAFNLHDHADCLPGIDRLPDSRCPLPEVSLPRAPAKGYRSSARWGSSISRRAETPFSLSKRRRRNSMSGFVARSTLGEVAHLKTAAHLRARAHPRLDVIAHRRTFQSAKGASSPAAEMPLPRMVQALTLLRRSWHRQITIGRNGAEPTQVTARPSESRCGTKSAATPGQPCFAGARNPPVRSG